MISEPELDRILASWLAEGSERAPADDLPVALEQVDRTRQRRSLPAWRLPHLPRGLAARFSLGVVVTLVAVTALSTAIPSVPQDAGSPSVGRLDFQWAAPWAAEPEGVAFTALMPVGATDNVYWRAAAYDTFELGAWSMTVEATTDVPAGGSLLRGSAEAPPDPFTTGIRATVRRAALRDDLLISPGTPVRVDADARVSSLGADGWLAAVEVPAVTYTVDARIPRLDGEGALSPDRLRAAGSDYPREVVEHYTAVPPGALGPKARALLAAIMSSTPGRDPYDLAVAIESSLQGPQFRYTTKPAPCDDASLVECFAQTRTGYCLHYASTMAILLRSAIPDHPVPTRLVQGFLPGERSGTLESVANRLAHTWVEVYFEDVGWIPFDPTAGAIGRPTTIPADVSPSGPAVP